MTLQLKYSDNFKTVLNQLKKDTAGLRVTHATVSANADFAKYLHHRKGYWVFNNEKLMMYVNREIKNLMNLKLVLTKPRLEKAVERGIVKYVNWLRSYTSNMRPPVTVGGAMRRAHPGGWADINKFLNRSYRYNINNGQWKVDPSWT